MRYVPPKKLKVLMMVFFGTGVFGIAVGLTQEIFMMTFMGVINLCLGGFFGWIFLNQEPRSKHKRKK
ncbi:MAG: hypothetical protein IH841_00925 [Thaumarchaeota archaeon]|nr:hypothetical protein [Nitrososphaerota archaeon]